MSKEIKSVSKVPMIEDDPKSVRKNLDRIEKISKEQNYPIKIEIIEPDSEFIFLQKITWNPELILIDYDFTQCRLKYSGKSVAGLLDDRFPDIPRILITREQVVADNPNISVDVPFDYLIYKGHLRSNAKNIVRLMISLIKNFQSISEYSVPERKWNSFLGLLSAENREVWMIQKIDPPVVQDKDSNLNESRWNPHTVTKWIFGTLFRYPGVLLDSLHASAFLGISKKSFIEVSEFFASARYGGAYSDIGDFWWKNRLREIALDIVLSAGLIPDIPTSFTNAFLEDQGAVLKPSICCTSQEKNADSICYILNKPVKTQYSFIYSPDTRPRGMDQARVSFKAVKTSDKFRMESLEEDDRIEAQALIDSARESD